MNVVHDAHDDFVLYLPIRKESPQRSPATTFFLCLLSTFLTLSSPWLNSPISKTPALGQPPTCFPESLLGSWGLSLCASLPTTVWACMVPASTLPMLTTRSLRSPTRLMPSLPLPQFISSAHAIHSPDGRLLTAAVLAVLSLPFLATCYCPVYLAVSCTWDVGSTQYWHGGHRSSKGIDTSRPTSRVGYGSQG